MSRFRCPACGFEYPLGGMCPSPYHNVMMIELPEEEENAPVKSIEYTGNKHRFCSQKSGILVDVRAVSSKKVSPEIIAHVGRDINTNRSCQFLVLTFIGDRGIPFQDIIGFGTTRKDNLEKDLGKIFDIDVPANGEQVEIELTNEVHDGN